MAVRTDSFFVSIFVAAMVSSEIYYKIEGFV